MKTENDSISFNKNKIRFNPTYLSSLNYWSQILFISYSTLHINIYFPNILSSSKPTDTSSCIFCSISPAPHIYFCIATKFPQIWWEVETGDQFVVLRGLWYDLMPICWNVRDRTWSRWWKKNWIFSFYGCSSRTASRRCSVWYGNCWRATLTCCVAVFLLQNLNASLFYERYSSCGSISLMILCFTCSPCFGPASSLHSCFCSFAAIAECLCVMRPFLWFFTCFCFSVLLYLSW